MRATRPPYGAATRLPPRISRLGRNSDEQTRVNRMRLLRESAQDYTNIPIECGCNRPLNDVAAQDETGFGARLRVNFDRDPFRAEVAQRPLFESSSPFPNACP